MSVTENHIDTSAKPKGWASDMFTPVLPSGVKMANRTIRCSLVTACAIAVLCCGCSEGRDVDYKQVVSPDGKSYVTEVDDEFTAKCDEAQARSPESGREKDPYCRALRVARLCVVDKICP